MNNFNILKIFSVETENVVNEIDNFLNQIITLVNLKNQWDDKNYLEIEIKKSFLRGILREHNLVKKLTKSILSSVKNTKVEKDFNWITNFYPMIHLSNDNLEAEEKLHYDSENGSQMLTCWVPITKYEYNGLNILKYENFFINFFKKFLTRSVIFNKFTFSPSFKKGNFFIWSGDRLHKGNLNTSKKISCALQMKFLKDPYLFESSYKIHDRELGNQKKIENEDYLKIYDDYVRVLKLIDKYSQNIKNINSFSIKDFVFNLKNNFNENNYHLSFSLSILSQRLRRLDQHNLNIVDKKKFHLYDIASIFLGSDNLISLKRVLSDNNELHKVFSDKNLLSEIDFLNICPKNTMQWDLILNKNMHKKAIFNNQSTYVN